MKRDDQSAVVQATDNNVDSEINADVKTNVTMDAGFFSGNKSERTDNSKIDMGSHNNQKGVRIHSNNVEVRGCKLF
jgi:hypothetical protein